jgi:hypothetical protein
MSASIQDRNMGLGDTKGFSKLTDGRPQSHAFGILVSADVAAHSSSKLVAIFTGAIDRFAKGSQ